MKRQLSHSLVCVVFLNFIINAELCGCMGQNSFSALMSLNAVSRLCMGAEGVFIAVMVVIVTVTLGVDGGIFVVVPVE